MPKTHDLVVTIGEYQDKNGETKKRRINIGSVVTNAKGNTFIMLNRHFNPAGVPAESGADSIIVGMFEVDNERGEQRQQAPSAPRQQKQQSAGPGFADFENDIPF